MQDSTIILRWTISIWTLAVMAPAGWAAPVAQESFESPDSGIVALVEAVKADDHAMLQSILGPDGSRLISSGDEVADKHNRDVFANAYDEGNRVVLDNDGRAVLIIGKDEWPMPIPLVKSGGRWRFDTVQGEKEILRRRIGRNELAAIQVCLAIVDAENEYAVLDVDGDGVPEYTPRFVSAPGTRNGLYWPTDAGGRLSPLGPLLAAATSEGYTNSASKPLAPYHGYFYRILTRQGKDAPGGAYDYMIKHRMIGGFAVIAYPARYGASGIMSFIVNQDGVVFESNLGKNTAAVASKTTTFDPDTGWKRVAPPHDSH